MSEYHATIQWKRGEAVFTDNRYSRGHVWRFDGGIEVPASSSPQVAGRTMAAFLENLGRWKRGEPLRNLVDPEAGY